MGIILLLFTACRLLFIVFNSGYFFTNTFFDWIVVCLHGIRFDVSAIIYLNLPFILLHLLPVKQRNTYGYQQTLFILFNITLITLLFANIADTVYFKFTLKRSTADVLELMFLGDDFIHLLPQFILDFWYLFVIWLLLSWTGYYWYKRIQWVEEETYRLPCRSALQGVLMVMTAALLAIGARGGVQLKPIGIINSGYYTASQNIPLVLNTPFSVISTLGKNELKEISYMADDLLDSIFTPVHYPNQKRKIPAMDNTNVVVIIMESFTNEYSRFFGKSEKTYTPFLDSLAAEGLSFDRCFANGKKSIEALPAVIAGLPTLMNNPYITSIYAGNRIDGLARHLHQKGYNTVIYHGGDNGTMGFDAFAKVSGFEHYFGRSEYGNDAHYDGKWGIYDEEFFQFFANGLNHINQPFLGCFISLSSHLPYMIPDRYNNKFTEGEL